MLRLSEAVAVLLLLVSAAAAAQAPDAGTTFSGSVDVREAQVEVLVTDREGRPVPDLTAADFRIREDGNPVEITQVSPAASRPVILAVFLDDTSLAGASRNLVVNGLRRFFAAGLRAGDRVLLVHYDGALGLQGEPTADVAVLGAALDRIASTAPRGSLLVQQRNTLQEDLLQALPPGQESQQYVAQSHASTYWDELLQYGRARSDATRHVLNALQQTIVLLSTLPERKAVLYLGGGLPLSPGADLLDLWMSKYETFASALGVSAMETTSWDATRWVQEVADRANAAGITLHTLALTAPGTATGAAIKTIGSTPSSDPEEAARGIRNLAAATGGRVVAELQNPAPFLEAAARDLGSGYVVGYTAGPDKGKKGRHKIDVKVRGVALAARYREERLDGGAVDPLLRSALAALWAGAGANPFGAELSIEEQAKEEDGRYRVTAILALPLAAVIFQPQEHFHVGHLTLAVVVRDGKGRISGVPRAEVPIEIPNQRLLASPGQSAGYRFTVHLAPGESILAIAMRDDLSGTQGVLRTALDPGSATGR